jgi:hypothetical protein
MMDTSESNLQAFKLRQIRDLPDSAGVYALCDLDRLPIYVGQAAASKDTSVRKRVQRHLTSARSDIIANRQLDVWEIAYVRGWVVDDPAARSLLEAQLFYLFDGRHQLINGTLPPAPAQLLERAPDAIEVCILPAKVIETRKDPAIRFPRQVQQFHQLLDYILNTQDKRHLRRALDVHHRRLNRFLRQFLETNAPASDGEDVEAG